MKFISNSDYGKPVETGTIFYTTLNGIKVTIHKIIHLDGWFLSCAQFQDVSKYEIGPFVHDDITKVEPYSTCPYCHTDIVLFMTRYIRDEYATEDQIRTTYKKAARDIMAYCEERISSGYKTSQINEFLKSKVERGYFK